MKHIIRIGSLMALLLAVACATTAQEATPTVAAREPTPTATSSAQPITITGVVLDVSLSARIITLTEPVQGFDTVALSDETEVLASSGCKAALQDVQKGMTVQASGKPGTSGAILASKVSILQAGST